MERDRKSQVDLWDENTINVSTVFYEWLLNDQREQVLALLMAPSPELWHPFVVK